MIGYWWVKFARVTRSLNPGVPVNCSCRDCHRLAYAGQNETPYLHAIRRVRKIRMRLGAGFSFAEPFPEKPPGMHWRTYLRMRLAVGESITVYDQP